MLIIEALEGLVGGPSIPYPFDYFEISHISEINMANIPEIQKALYPHIPKIDPSIPYPFKYLQKCPASLKVFGKYTCIPETPSRAVS